MSTEQTDQPLECPVCGSREVDKTMESFDGICEECGVVVRSELNQDEWNWTVRNEDNDQDGDEWLDQIPIQNATEKRLAQAFGSLESLADSHQIGCSIREEAADIYCDAFLVGVTDGRKTKRTVAASLRVATVRSDHPIPMSKLAESAEIQQSELRLALQSLKQELELHPPTPKPDDFLAFIEKTLDIDSRDTVRKILDNVADEACLVGKDPAGIAGAVCYLIHEELTQADVAEAAGVSVETIRQRSNQLQELTALD